MAEIPNTEPTEIIAGDTTKWKRIDLSDYPASTWTLKYVFRGPSVQNITAIADGNNFSVTISAAISANWVAGDYVWEAYVTKGAGENLERYRIDSGYLKVKPNLEGVAGIYDGRTYVKKVLDAIEATIEGTATKEQASITVAGRTLTRRTIEELLALRDKFRVEYVAEQKAEKIKNGLATGGKILTRFK